jgi:hypothetical protein
VGVVRGVWGLSSKRSILFYCKFAQVDADSDSRPDTRRRQPTREARDTDDRDHSDTRVSTDSPPAFTQQLRLRVLTPRGGVYFI